MKKGKVFPARDPQQRVERSKVEGCRNRSRNLTFWVPERGAGGKMARMAVVMMMGDNGDGAGDGGDGGDGGDDVKVVVMMAMA